MKNYNLLEVALRELYNNKGSWNYLTLQQIEGILDFYFNEMNQDLDLESYIDNVLVNGSGFDKFGKEIVEEE